MMCLQDHLDDKIKQLCFLFCETVGIRPFRGGYLKPLGQENGTLKRAQRVLDRPKDGLRVCDKVETQFDRSAEGVCTVQGCAGESIAALDGDIISKGLGDLSGVPCLQLTGGAKVNVETDVGRS